MEANFIFPNVKAYNVERADVLLGETFRVELGGSDIIPLWFSSNDKVLKFEDDFATATITATAVGDSEIRLFDGDTLLKKLSFSVYSTEAASLNVKAGKATLK
jgi:hypothetical protein